jgi:hypothetical protein
MSPISMMSVRACISTRPCHEPLPSTEECGELEQLWARAVSSSCGHATDTPLELPGGAIPGQRSTGYGARAYRSTAVRRD